MNKNKFLLVLGMSIFGMHQASAQETVNDSIHKEEIFEENDLKEIIVTGNSNPKRKIETSTAITTFTDKEIQKQNPISTASLLQKVPGFAVETSGGEVGNNLFARGIPSAGAYEYVQIQEDGMPVFEDGALQFANADNFFRVDANLARLEALRGGSGSIFASNAPGGIINFISKEGQNKFGGNAKFETSDYGLFRLDANVGGAIIEDKLFYNAGGFYRIDNGIRNPGYRANEGGQIKLNVKYKFNSGYVKMYYKKLDDKNLFLLPIPLMQDGNKISEFPGFNANYGTYASNNYGTLSIPQLDGSTYTRDLRNGVHPKVDVIGNEFKLDLGQGFSILNKLRYTTIDQNYTAIYPSGTPTTAADFANNYTTAAGEASPIADNNYQYSYVDNGAIANPAYVQKVGFWAIDKKMKNFANDFRVDYKKEKFSMSLGFYKSAWESKQNWNWSNLLVEVSDRARLLNLVDTSLSPTDQGYAKTYNGVADISWMMRSSEIKGDVNAFYYNVDVQVSDKLNLNGGLRYDFNTYKGWVDQGSWGNPSNLDDQGLGNTTADNSMLVSVPRFAQWEYNVEKLSGTIAANYKFDNSNAVFARYSHGFRSPIEEAIYDNYEDLKSLKPTVTNQYEVGYKLYKPTFDATVIVFSSQLDDIRFSDILANGQSENAYGSTKNFGLEVESNVRLLERKLELTLNGTIQDPKFKTMKQNGEDLEGNTVRRIPKLYFTFTPAVNITKEWRAYASMNYYGKRYSDNQNRQVLPSFTEFGAGTSYQWNKFRFAVDATNIFNEIGLTEGDPRSNNLVGQGIIMARPIMGAAVRASVAITF